MEIRWITFISGTIHCLHEYIVNITGYKGGPNACGTHTIITFTSH